MKKSSVSNCCEGDLKAIVLERCWTEGTDLGRNDHDLFPPYGNIKYLSDTGQQRALWARGTARCNAPDWEGALHFMNL